MRSQHQVDFWDEQGEIGGPFARKFAERIGSSGESQGADDIGERLKEK